MFFIFWTNGQVSVELKSGLSMRLEGGAAVETEHETLHTKQTAQCVVYSSQAT